MNQPFIQHVQELRRRLTISVGVLIVGATVGYLARDPILTWLQAPLHGTLYYSQVMGAFEFLMQACFLVGLLFAIPVVVYNLIAFIRPALPGPVSGRQIAAIVVVSCLLTVGGASFAYYVTLPVVLKFLSSVDVTHLHPLIAANSYLTFVINYLAVFALIFQLPLIMIFIDRIRPIPPASLKKLRKWVILGAFGLALILPILALILPIAPDPVSQLNLALPIVILYEVSLWLVVMAHRRRKARQTDSSALDHFASSQTRDPGSKHRQPATAAVYASHVRPRSQVIDLRNAPQALDLRNSP
jgi:sec-independent protein translocase protein TatC